jgi:hypothetical protein
VSRINKQALEPGNEAEGVFAVMTEDLRAQGGPEREPRFLPPSEPCMESTLQVVDGFAASATLTRLVDDFIRPRPGGIILRYELVEKVLEISGRRVVRHQPEADPGTRVAAGENGSVVQRNLGQLEIGPSRTIAKASPSIRKAFICVHYDTNAIERALQKNWELVQEPRDPSGPLDERPGDGVVIPVKIMPLEEMDNRALIVHALHEEAVGAFLGGLHQRTSIWPRAAIAISSIV